MEKRKRNLLSCLRRTSLWVTLMLLLAALIGAAAGYFGA